MSSRPSRYPRLLLPFIFVLVSTIPGTDAVIAQQEAAYWADDGCYYQMSGTEWFLVGCMQAAADGTELFVSAEFLGQDGFTYYYEHSYTTGVTTWYTWVVDETGAGYWLNYDAFLAMHAEPGASDTSANQCGVIPAGQPGSLCDASGRLNQPGESGASDAPGNQCGVIPAGQPGSLCDASGQLIQPRETGVGYWADDGCYYSVAQQREGCLIYSDAGSSIFVSVEMTGTDGFRYYYTYDYGTNVQTWYTLVTYADGTSEWMNYDAFVQSQTGGSTDTGGNACGVIPAGQPGSTCDAPEAAPTVAAWDVVTLTTYVNANLDSYWAAWFASQGWQHVSPTWMVGPNLSSSCGTTYGPFYCSTDYRMYLDEPYMNSRLANPGDFGVALIIAHEYAHHIQALTGADRSDSIAFELQADCLAGVWANSAYFQGILDDGDLDEGMAVLWSLGDDYLGIPIEIWEHGSSEQRRASFLSGYNTGDPLQCY